MIELNSHLKSLCINTLEISREFLAALIKGPISLKRLSIYSCLLQKEDVEWFLKELKSTNQTMIIYTSITVLDEDKLIQKSDNWFMQEQLDIFSLWEMATVGSR